LKNALNQQLQQETSNADEINMTVVIDSNEEAPGENNSSPENKVSLCLLCVQFQLGFISPDFTTVWRYC